MPAVLRKDGASRTAVSAGVGRELGSSAGARRGFIVRDLHPSVSVQWFLLCSLGEVAACCHSSNLQVLETSQLICSDC